jgi:prolyl oligopeptidase
MLESRVNKILYYVLCSVFVLSFNQISLTQAQSTKDVAEITPPRTKVSPAIDTVHGEIITDPYRWLEDGQVSEVQKWTDEQNAYTRFWLDRIPQRNSIYRRLEELMSIGFLGTPVARGDRIFYRKRKGTENQPKLYLKEGVKNRPQVVIDPNTWSQDGTKAMDWWMPSCDGRLVAYGVSEGGSEKSTLFVKDISTGVVLPDVIPHTRYADIAWLKDNRGFYYTRYPEPGTVPEGEENYHQHVFFHKLGTPPNEDPLIFGQGRPKEEMPGISISPDGRYLLLSVWQGWSKSEIYFKDLKKGEDFVPVVKDLEGLFWGQILDHTLYLFTNYKAPHYHIYAVDLKKPEPENWKVLIPESDAILQNFDIVDNHLVAEAMENAFSKLLIHTLNGELETEIPLPTMGSVYGVNGEWDSNHLFFGFESFFLPRTDYHYDMKSKELEIFDQLKTDLDFSGFEHKQVWYESKDGTKVSMFVVHKKGLRLNGQNPTLLTGYGGFNASMTPYFSEGVYFWLENGGVFALPNLRGGGEYGEKWHQAGMFENKQNVFDDFIWAGEWLIDQGYTNPENLAISGGSNGGLLVGAALTQRPDLFKAVVCRVPLLDMVRFHKFDIARLWIPEYGSAEKSEQFKYIYAYSPYHHVQKGVEYPAVLLTAGTSDSRVNPLHARKMAALLQSASISENPILLRVETKAGHGQGKPFSKRIQERTDIYSFLFWQLGMPR